MKPTRPLADADRYASWRIVLSVIAFAAYPVATHILVVYDVPRIAVLALVLFAALYLLRRLFNREGAAHRRSLVIYGMVFVVGIINLLTHSVQAIFIPFISVNLLLAYLVGRSLRGENVPLLERVAHINGRKALPERARHLFRVLTLVWALFFLVMAVISLGLALLAPLKWWSLFSNILYFILLPTLIVGMHLYQLMLLRDTGAALTLNLFGRLLVMPLTDPAHPFFGYSVKPGR